MSRDQLTLMGRTRAPMRLAVGDNREVLARLPANTFHAGVTDPTYEIKLLGNKWDATGVAFDIKLWREMLRVLRPGAPLLAFGTPRTFHRLVTAIEDSGFVIADEFVWLKGGANMPYGGWVSPAIDKHLGLTREVVGSRVLYGTAALSTVERGGTHSIGVDSRGAKKEVPITKSASEQAKQWDGWAWNLKRVQEKIVLAHKPFDGSQVASLLKWGTGALNVTGEAVPASQGSEVRWPSNVLLTPESAAELSEQSGTTKSASNTKPTKQCGKAFHGNGKPQVWAAEALNKGDSGTAERYFHKFIWCRKANKVEKGPAKKGDPEACPVDSVKPLPLLRHLVNLTARPGSLIIDPFSGSGTTLEAASSLGVTAFGIELMEAHAAWAMKRWGIEPWELDGPKMSSLEAR